MQLPCSAGVDGAHSTGSGVQVGERPWVYTLQCANQPASGCQAQCALPNALPPLPAPCRRCTPARPTCTMSRECASMVIMFMHFWRSALDRSVRVTSISRVSCLTWNSLYSCSREAGRAGAQVRVTWLTQYASGWRGLAGSWAAKLPWQGCHDQEADCTGCRPRQAITPS